MNETPAIGFGGFLLGLGVGWLVFKELSLGANNLAWLVIIIGASIVLSGIIRWLIPNQKIGRITGSISGGLIFALIITQGAGIFQIFSNNGGFGNLPYTSLEIKSYTGLSPQDKISLRLGGMNGDITLSTWDKNEYRIEANIKARGATQKEADDNLGKLVGKEILSESTNDGLKLTLIFTSIIPLNNPYQINLDVKLPAEAVLDLDLSSSNGEIDLEYVQGGVISLQTSNGGIYLTNIRCDNLKCSTSNGVIKGGAEAKQFNAYTSNAKIELSIPGTFSGVYDMSTSNGQVNVKVGSSAACKLRASTTNSDVNFNIPNLVYSQNDRTNKRAQSNNYDTAPIKAEINITTSNASVDVRRNTLGF